MLYPTGELQGCSLRTLPTVLERRLQGSGASGFNPSPCSRWFRGALNHLERNDHTAWVIPFTAMAASYYVQVRAQDVISAHDKHLERIMAFNLRAEEIERAHEKELRAITRVFDHVY